MQGPLAAVHCGNILPLECVIECVTFVDEKDACFSQFFAICRPHKTAKYLIYYAFFCE
jgi:hypothetical protein